MIILTYCLKPSLAPHSPWKELLPLFKRWLVTSLPLKSYWRAFKKYRLEGFTHKYSNRVGLDIPHFFYMWNKTFQVVFVSLWAKSCALWSCYTIHCFLERMCMASCLYSCPPTWNDSHLPLLFFPFTHTDFHVSNFWWLRKAQFKCFFLSRSFSSHTSGTI